MEKLVMSKEDISENIERFIVENSNGDGIDLSKIYFAKLHYREPMNTNISQIFGIQCPINLENNPNEIAVVYILESQSGLDHIYVDIFNKTLLQSTCVSLPNMFSFAPILRDGVTVSESFNMGYVLGVDRLTYEQLTTIYKRIVAIDLDELLNMENEELSKLCLDELQRRKR